MDLVYVLGSGSVWEDNELRYSLRSLETYLTDLGEVFVIGPRPKWLTGVNHFYFPDKFPCKEKNIMLKLAHACGHPDLSKTFLHVHDDHFMLGHGSGLEIPNWCGGSLEATAKPINPRNHWRDAVLNTHRVLSARGLTTHNFDMHYPMLFDKELYPKTMDEYDWTAQRGYVVKSLYANTVGVKPTKNHDMLIRERYDLPELVRRIKGKPWWSLNNGGLNNFLKSLLQALYPNPSRFEIK